MRKPTGQQGLVPSLFLIPYYPYCEIVRINFEVDNEPTSLRKGEIVDISDKVEFDSPTDGRHVWRPWAKKRTGETGIAPDYVFGCTDLFGPLRPRIPLPGGVL